MEYYFDYELNSKTIKEFQKYQLSFFYNLEGYNDQDFVVVPNVNVGKVMLDTQKLLKTSEIEFISIGNQNVVLYFELLNTVDGKKYLTPTYTLINDSKRLTYIAAVNKNIELFAEQTPAETEKKSFVKPTILLGSFLIIVLIVLSVRKYGYAKKVASVTRDDDHNIFNISNSRPNN